MERDINYLLERLAKSKFRSKFHLTAKDRDYVQKKGMAVIREHAVNFVEMRLAGMAPKNDGKQTPMRGHPVFVAQHATGTCCRGCLYKWHGIASGKVLSEVEKNYIVDVIMEWIKRELS